MATRDNQESIDERQKAHTCYLHNFFHQSALHFAIGGRQLFVLIRILPHFFCGKKGACIFANVFDITLVVYRFSILENSLVDE